MSPPKNRFRLGPFCSFAHNARGTLRNLKGSARGYNLSSGLSSRYTYSSLAASHGRTIRVGSTNLCRNSTAWSSLVSAYAYITSLRTKYANALDNGLTSNAQTNYIRVLKSYLFFSLQNRNFARTRTSRTRTMRSPASACRTYQYRRCYCYCSTSVGNHTRSYSYARYAPSSPYARFNAGQSQSRPKSTNRTSRGSSTSSNSGSAYRNLSPPTSFPLTSYSGSNSLW